MSAGRAAGLSSLQEWAGGSRARTGTVLVANPRTDLSQAAKLSEQGRRVAGARPRQADRRTDHSRRDPQLARRAQCCGAAARLLGSARGRFRAEGQRSHMTCWAWACGPPLDIMLRLMEFPELPGAAGIPLRGIVPRPRWRRARSLRAASHASPGRALSRRSRGVDTVQRLSGQPVSAKGGGTVSVAFPISPTTASEPRSPAHRRPCYVDGHIR